MEGFDSGGFRVFLGFGSGGSRGIEGFGSGSSRGIEGFVCDYFLLFGSEFYSLSFGNDLFQKLLSAVSGSPGYRCGILSSPVDGAELVENFLTFSNGPCLVDHSVGVLANFLVLIVDHTSLLHSGTRDIQPSFRG